MSRYVDKRFMDGASLLSKYNISFVHECTNAHRAIDEHGNVCRYMREDLAEWAKEAHCRGDSYFYTEKDTAYKNRLKLCKPKYVYKVYGTLSEEDYFNFVNEISTRVIHDSDSSRCCDTITGGKQNG